MPEYVYRDAAGHEVTYTQRMGYTTAVICGCGLEMHRKPQTFLVNWGGLKPSQGELSKPIKELIETAPARRDATGERRGT